MPPPGVFTGGQLFAFSSIQKFSPPCRVRTFPRSRRHGGPLRGRQMYFQNCTLVLQSGPELAKPAEHEFFHNRSHSSRLHSCSCKKPREPRGEPTANVLPELHARVTKSTGIGQTCRTRIFFVTEGTRQGFIVVPARSPASPVANRRHM